MELAEAIVDERAAALRLLYGLENGTLPTADAAPIAGEIDPVLLYVVVRYLRAAYPASDPAANAVLGRVVELTSRGGAVVRRFKQGAADPVSRWFEQNYVYRDFRGRGRELIDTVAEKLDG